MTFSIDVNKEDIEIKINDTGIFFAYTTIIKGNSEKILDFITRFFSRKIYDFIFPNLCKIGRYFYNVCFESGYIYELKSEFNPDVIRGEKIWRK